MSAALEKTAVTAFKAPGTAAWRGLVSSEAECAETREQIAATRTELQNTLRQSLQMQHLVVLAGSGCSMSAGGPSMDTLWSEVVGHKPNEAAVSVAKEVNFDLQSCDLEELLSRIESLLQIASNKADEDSLKEIPAWKFLLASKKIILDKCSDFLRMGKLGDHKIFLHRLSRRRARDHRLRLFTTNYDLCFETAASELGGVVLDGFSFAPPRRYDPRFFGYDIVNRQRSGDDKWNYLEGVFLLYKLHGSVNWERNEAGAIYEKDNPDPSQACLIYPANGKFRQSFVQPHLEAMTQFLAAIREPNTCVLVVGFGLKDDHIAGPLLAAAESNPHMRLILVDMAADEKVDAGKGNHFWAKLSELSERGEDVWFIKASFGDFARLVPDLNALTPVESLAKAIVNSTGTR